MCEQLNSNNRRRSRAQSIFEYRKRTGTDISMNLLERLISNGSISKPSNDRIFSHHSNEFDPRQRCKRTIFFVFEPIVASLFIFPLLILYWQSGWNFMDKWLNTSFGQRWFILFLFYCLAQAILFITYLNQDNLYEYLQKQKSTIFVTLILQAHTLLVASTYILQWVSMWTIWDRYTSQDWLLMIIVSVAAILGIIILMGHPCDLVCAPFIISFDSIDYNIRIGSPFLTDNMNEYFCHFLNYIIYEYLISLLSILAWRGVYALLDVFLFPENPSLSATISLTIGYPTYFLLMYTQDYCGRKNILPSFLILNYPLLVQNIRHLFAFFTCVLLWRGFWLLFDTHIEKFNLAMELPYQFYFVCNLLAFVALSILKSASSINGPMSHMDDRLNLFPDYPNSYLVELLDTPRNIDDSSTNSSGIPSLEQYHDDSLE